MELGIRTALKLVRATIRRVHGRAMMYTVCDGTPAMREGFDIKTRPVKSFNLSPPEETRANDILIASHARRLDSWRPLAAHFSRSWL